jgi:hypothetical protein
MRASLDRLLDRPGAFPLELTLSNGEKHVLPHPDHADVHPKTRDLVIYPDDGRFSVVINPAQIVSIRMRRATV